MPVLLVLCDPEDSDLIEDAIKKYGKMFRLSGSDHLISTDRHRDELWSELRRAPGIRSPDSLLLVPMQEPFRGAAKGQVPRWLQDLAADVADDSA